MNEEFSGGGQGAGAQENKGWDHCEGSGRWERKGRVMGERGGNYPAMLKMTVKIYGQNLPRRFEMEPCPALAMKSIVSSLLT